MQSDPPPIDTVVAKEWQAKIEPIIADWVRSAGSRLRRHRVRIGPWVLELVTENGSTHQIFAQHWFPASAGESPHAYCYLIPEGLHDYAIPKKRRTRRPKDCTVQCVACPDHGRVLVWDPIPYSDVNQICDALISAVAVRTMRASKYAARKRPSELWWVLPATSVEYLTEAGDTRSVTLIGGAEIQRITSGYGLALCKPGNGLVSDSVTVTQIDSGTLFPAKARLWWPTALVETFRHLLAHFVMNPFQGLQIDSQLTEMLREYRNASDLVRAIDGGSFPEEHCQVLREILAGALSAHSLLDPRELLGSDRCLEQSQMTDLIRCTYNPDIDCILDKLPQTAFLASCDRDYEWFGGRFGKTVSRAHENSLAQLLETTRVRTTVLNQRLSNDQTQFCLRHFLEGYSDSIRILSPDYFGDSSILGSMRLDRFQSNGRANAPRDSFMHGLRHVCLVAFLRQGELRELVAFDPLAGGYAQVRSVWPGQVADFFSRHAPLRVRELFKSGEW